MKLMDKESLLLESDDKQIFLTSHRIRQESKQWGKLKIKSIMLEHVSSCEYVKTSQPLFLILGIIGLILGIALIISGEHSSVQIAGVSILVGICFLLTYWMSTKKVLFVSSSSSKILINTVRLKDENIKAFINTLETAKNERIYSFCNNNSISNSKFNEIE